LFYFFISLSEIRLKIKLQLFFYETSSQLITHIEAVTPAK